MNTNDTRDTQNDDWENALRGQPVSDEMTSKEKKLVCDIREELIWEEAIKEAEELPGTQTEQSWQSFKKHLPLLDTASDESVVGGASVHKFPDKNSDSLSKQQWTKYLPVAASLAAISLSLYIFMESQFDRDVIEKGFPYNSDNTINSSIPQHYSMTESQMQLMISELMSAGLQVGVENSASQGNESADKITIHLSNLGELSKNGRALLDKHSISVMPNVESQVLIVELVQP